MRSTNRSNSGLRPSPSGSPAPSAGRSSEARPSRATQYTIGKSSWSTSASRSRNSSSTSWTTSAMRASGRSTLLMTRITGSLASSVLRSTKRVWGSGPSDASTSRSTPSTIDSARSTSPPKSAWPGVSTMLIVTSPWRTAVFLARIVMPFSRSRSIESITRSATSWLARNAPDCQSIASTSVVLPWSTWATMATLRRSWRATSIAVQARRRRAHAVSGQARRSARSADPALHAPLLVALDDDAVLEVGDPAQRLVVEHVALAEDVVDPVGAPAQPLRRRLHEPRGHRGVDPPPPDRVLRDADIDGVAAPQLRLVGEHDVAPVVALGDELCVHTVGPERERPELALLLAQRRQRRGQVLRAEHRAAVDPGGRRR